MRVFAIIVFTAMLLPACAANHQGQANPAAFALNDAGQPSEYYKFDDEKYLRSISNVQWPLQLK